MPSAPPPKHWEVDGSPAEQWKANGFTATRVFRTAWLTRFAFIEWMLGGTKGFVRTYPQKYPHNSKALAKSAAPRGYGNPRPAKLDQSIMEYDFAEVTVTYELPRYPQGTIGGGGTAPPIPVRPFRTEDIDTELSVTPLDSTGLFFNSGYQVPDEVKPQRVETHITWIVTLHEMDAIPKFTTQLLGTVNAGAEKSALLDFAFPAETLLYRPPRIRPTHKADGNVTYDVAYELQYRPGGWNTAWNRYTDAYEVFYDDTDPTTRKQIRLYAKKTFKPLTRWQP